MTTKTKTSPSFLLARKKIMKEMRDAVKTGTLYQSAEELIAELTRKYEKSTKLFHRK